MESRLSRLRLTLEELRNRGEVSRSTTERDIDTMPEDQEIVLFSPDFIAKRNDIYATSITFVEDPRLKVD